MQEEKPQRPTRKRFKTSDATLESFVQVHSQNPRGLAVVRDELAGWFGSFDRYAGKGSSDTQAWIEMHGGKSVTVDRKTSEVPVIYLASPNATVIGGIQPKVFKSIIGPQFFHSGFIARLLMVMPPQNEKRWTDADVEIDVRDRYFKLVNRLYSYQPVEDKPLPIPLSHEAKRLWVDYYNEHAELTAKLPDGALRAAMSKMEFMAARFALILQIASETAGKAREISYTPMLCGIGLARWFRRETARIYLELDFEGSTLDELQRLVVRLPDPFRYQDLEELLDIKKSGAFKRIRKMEELAYVERIAENQYAHRVEQFKIDWSIFENDSLDTRTQDTLDTLPKDEPARSHESVQSVPVSSVPTNKSTPKPSELETDYRPSSTEAPF